MSIIYIDFETRSEVDIKKSGGWVYAKDPSTDVLCVSFIKDKEEPQTLPFVMGEFNIYPKISLNIFRALCEDQNNIFVAHNASFEMTIYASIFVKRFNFPVLPPSRWRCTLAQCLAANVPGGLKKAADFLELEEKKDTFGNTVMLQLSKPKRITKEQESIWVCTSDKYKTLYHYCEQDVKVSKRIFNFLPKLSSREQKVWELDYKINNYGFKCDAALIKKAKEVMDKYATQIDTELYEISEGHIKSYSMLNSFKEYFKKLNYPVDSLNKEKLKEILADKNAPFKVKKIIELRKAIGKTSVKKYITFDKASDEDFIMRGTLQYHAASTGRWGGRLVQVQNLPRGSFETTEKDIQAFINNNYEYLFNKYGHELIEYLSSNLRGCITAREDKTLLWSDFNAIETRVLAWLANEDKILDSYAKGRDIYCEMATSIYDKKITKEDKNERHMGKKAILGCGFGMGPVRFKNICDVEGNLISLDFAEQVIHTYRSNYSSVPRLWRQIDTDVRQCILEKGRLIVRDKYKITTNNDVMFIQLPSGRNLCYFNPRIEREGVMTYKGINPRTKKIERVKIYGGKLVENIVQAIARDLLVNAMFNIETNGRFKIVFTVHDEIVVEAPKINTSETSLEAIINHLMVSFQPDWAKNIPLHAEANLGFRYKK